MIHGPSNIKKMMALVLKPKHVDIYLNKINILAREVVSTASEK